jgi:FSR family fosmidomycin resistance protein-like MFS transporter
MHFVMDGLTTTLVPFQPQLAQQTGARPALLGLVVATALATSSLLQPLAARLVQRRGERAVAVAGAILAALGYGAVPAVTSVAQAVILVVIGGIGSALFHPAAGALVAGTARRGREATALALFSAVGTAGAAIVPFAILSSVPALGSASAVPVAVSLVVMAVLTVTARPSDRRPAATSKIVARRGSGRRGPRLAITTGAFIALASTTVGATSAVLTAGSHGASHPLVAWTVAVYSAAGAVGGVALAAWSRRVGVRTALLSAVAVGALSASLVPVIPGMWRMPLLVPAGAGLSGSLPLLVGHARRPGEGSAAGAVGRILGLAGGLGGAGYAGVGLLQSALGYGVAQTLVAGFAGLAALTGAWFLCRGVDPASCAVTPSDAAMGCGCGSCACA